MAPSRHLVAIGSRDHSGWAVLVTVALGDQPGAFAVLDRRRVELLDPELPRQPYHAAVGSSLDEAAALVERVEESARLTASTVLAEVRCDLSSGGHEVAGLAVAADTMAVPTSLEAVLGSHPLLHAAEGALYREALVDGAERAGIPVRRFVARSVIADAATEMGLPGELGDRLHGLRGQLGPPWQKDHKEAAAAALLALASAQ